jgi:hypothetical protein
VESNQKPMIVVDLAGPDGNAFVLLAVARQALREAGRRDECDQFAAEATSGDYEHLLDTMDKWFDMRKPMIAPSGENWRDD